MEKVLLIIIAIICAMNISSCSKNDNNEYTIGAIPDSIINAPYIDDAASWLDSSMIGQRILISARVSYVSASKKYCILTGSSKRISIRLEAGKNLTGFNRELTGCEIVSSGKLQEKRFEETDLKAQRSDILKMIEAYGYTSKTDTTGIENYNRLFVELRDIDEMIKWIESNNYSHYSTLSLDCEDYVILN